MKHDEIGEEIFEMLKNRRMRFTLCELSNEFQRGEIGVIGYLTFVKNEITPGELHQQLHVSSARMAKILNTLEEKGYIQRKVDENDRRKVVVIATDVAQQLAMHKKKIMLSMIDKVIEEVGYENIKQYICISNRIDEILIKEKGESIC